MRGSYINKTISADQWKNQLNAAQRCGSCRSWDVVARRCCNSKSPLFPVLAVLRHETCGEWDDLRNLYKQRDSE